MTETTRDRPLRKSQQQSWGERRRRIEDEAGHRLAADEARDPALREQRAQWERAYLADRAHQARRTRQLYAELNRLLRRLPLDRPRVSVWSVEALASAKSELANAAVHLRAAARKLERTQAAGELVSPWERWRAWKLANGY